MKRRLLTIISAIWFASLFSFEAKFVRDPVLSPDGTTICFTYLSDLWIVPFEGGNAKRLTTSDAEDSNPTYAYDGKSIFFNSNREGNNGIYQIPADGGKAKQITNDSHNIIQAMKDNETLLVSQYIAGIGTGFYKFPINGKRGELITEIGEIFADLTADESKIIYTKRGSWERERYSGSHNGELWVYDIKTKSYDNISNTEYTERYVASSHINDKTFFCASDGDVFQLYEVTGLDYSTKKQLSSFKSKQFSPRDLSVAQENNRLVYEYFDQLGTYNPETKKTKLISIEIKEDLVIEHDFKTTLRNNMHHFEISPNKKFIVFAEKYDLFAMPLKGGEVKQLTNNQAGIDDISIMPDNKTIYFTSFEKGAPKLHCVKLDELEKIKPISKFKKNEISYIFRTDSGSLAVEYMSKKRRINYALIDSVGKITKLDWLPELIEHISFSPDGRFIAVSERYTHTWDSNLSIFEIESKKQHLLFETDDYFHNIAWSNDSKTLFYTRGGDIYRLDLEPKSSLFFQKDNWEEILAFEEENKEKDEQEKKDKTFKVKWEDLSKRAYKIIKEDGYNYYMGCIDDTTFYYGNNHNDKWNIKKANFFGKNSKIVKSISMKNEWYQFAQLDGNLFYLKHNRLKNLNLKTKKEKSISYKTKYEYNKKDLNKSVFDFVWNTMKRDFYDPEMHGQDWEKLYNIFSTKLNDAETTRDLGSIVDEMVGELDASHTGFYPRNELKGKSYSNAYLGIEFDYSKPLKKGLKIKKVYSESELATVHNIKNGDILLSVNGIEITPKTQLSDLFLNKADEDLKLTIKSDSTKEIELKPISGRTQYQFRYNDWVAERRAKVNAVNSKLGYLHIQGMDSSSLDKFREEVYAATKDKDGLIIDVRGNGGGWIHDYLLEILTKKPYGLQTVRNDFAKKKVTPGRSFDKPVILLINEDSFSDAEIFPHLFKFLKLGKVVGMPTSGSVIGTTHMSYLDGSSMRLPRNGWYTLDGVNMEGNGCQPDILVPLSPENKIKDNDVQLLRAIEELEKEL